MRNERGYILVMLLMMMVLLAVTAMGLNRRAGLQARMAANQIQSVRTALGQAAGAQEAVWLLTQDPCWRTSTSGADFTYDGMTYNRKVLDSTVSGYTDAVTISVLAPGGTKAYTSSFRYHLHPVISGENVDFAPHHIAIDNQDNIYAVDPNNHVVYKRDAITAEITIVVGTGTAGYSGDGGLAASAQLNRPMGLHFSGSASVMYIADTGNHVIRKVAANGDISTLAGTGTAGYSGDDGPGTAAELREPCGVFETAGDTYIADTGNHVIRRVAANGKIYALAGTGTAGYSGDGGPGTAAELREPHAVFESAGEIFIADTSNHVLRLVDVAGDISTLAGTGAAGYSGDGGPATGAQINGPVGLHLDAAGNIYIADTGNHVLRLVDDEGDISTLAGTGTAGYSGDGGAATSAQLDNPKGVCLDTLGVIVIGDANNNRLRQIDSGGNIASLFAPGGMGLDGAEEITLDSSGNLYIADTNNHRIKKLDTNNAVTVLAGNGVAGFSGDGGSATGAQLDKPRSVTRDGAGNLYIADTKNHRVRKVDTSGDITTYAGDGTAGFSVGGGGPATDAKMKAPAGVFALSSGVLFIADTENHVIRRVDSSGNMTEVAGDTTGGVTQPGYSGDGGAATAALLNGPTGLYVTSDETIYIADTNNHCIRKVDGGTGVITTFAGTGSSGYSGDGGAATGAALSSPRGVFVDEPGNVFIADTGNHKIRVVCSDGVIGTLAGATGGGFNGLDGPAVEVKLKKPSTVAMAAGRGGLKIFLSDTDNNRIRILNWELAQELY